MWRRLLGGLAVILTLLAVPGAIIAADNAVTNIRIGDHGDRTRVVIESDNPVKYQIFTLSTPYRLVVDLPPVDWRVPEGTASAKGGVVDGLRFGAFDRGTGRLVLDLSGPAEVARAFALEPAGPGSPHRLVVDLDRVTVERFAETAPPPPPDSAPAPPLRPRPPQEQAALPSSPAAASRVTPPPEKPTIVIDPGHGGVDPGAIGKSGTKEKHVTLAMAKELAEALRATGRYNVALTRETDVFIRLQDRVHRARQAGADLFISVHADSHPKTSTKGLSIYTLSEKASDREAERLAHRENKADLIAGMDLSTESPDVTGILIDLAQRETMNMSARFAGFAVNELADKVTVLNRTHRFAGFVVLKAPDVPSILVELGYLSNPQEEDKLGDRRYRARIEAALVKAVDRYFHWKTAAHRS